MRPSDDDPSTRRALLAAVGSAAVASLAGCLASGATGPRSGDRPEVVTPTDSPTPTATPGGFSAETIERARETGLAVRPSVLAMSPDPPRIQGTGWYFREPDLIATVGHLFVRTEDWVAWQPDGTKLDPTYVDDAYLDGVDVAAMRTEVDGPPLSTGDDEALDPGQPLVQVGNPGGVGNWVISLGRYLGETDGEADGFRSTVPARGGASGSPTLTLDGEVVGMLSGTAFPESGLEGTTETTGTDVYGPDDRIMVEEHVGIDAVVDRIEGWTDE
jgi:serine protease Do